ncbi:hypothetical protein TNIN_155211 [Trichonephila inaurata madagascariensis]|uniref:Uncharacterized protein n=1 Tax=Trichonephila inaurata madagascariensis TaxID=2747483 RepID=A0A8X6Y8X3_9ARAC|nr:hypothetical protein TNIN_155211 [Trichonephila inaurata madagascariensis]
MFLDAEHRFCVVLLRVKRARPRVLKLSSRQPIYSRFSGKCFMRSHLDSDDVTWEVVMGANDLLSLRSFFFALGISTGHNVAGMKIVVSSSPSKTSWMMFT